MISRRADAVVDEVRLLRLLRSTADDVAVLLAEHGVLDVELARWLRQAVGFRNVLLHD